MKVGELCKRLEVSYRHARYVLEEGILPKGVAETPGRGEHRDLSPEQAFWLGIVLLLRQIGMRSALAAKIADMTFTILRNTAQMFNWEPSFDPARGQFKTSNDWYADIGDLRYFRMATSADPTGGRRIREGGWRDFRDKREAKEAKPLAIIRLDLARLASRLDTSPKSD